MKNLSEGSIKNLNRGKVCGKICNFVVQCELMSVAIRFRLNKKLVYANRKNKNI